MDVIYERSFENWETNQLLGAAAVKLSHYTYFHVIIYNSETCIGILNTDLDSKLKLEF